MMKATPQRCSFTLMEVMIAFSIFMLFLAGASNVFTQGNRMFLRGTWHLHGSKNLQLYLTLVREDMERACNALTIEKVGIDFKLKTDNVPIHVLNDAYNKGKFPNNLTKVVEVDENKVPYKATIDANFVTQSKTSLGVKTTIVPIFSGHIYSTNKQAIGEANSGNWIGFCLYLKGGDLFYLRTDTAADKGFSGLKAINSAIDVPAITTSGGFTNAWTNREKFFNKNLALADHKPVLSGVSRVGVIHQEESGSSGKKNSIQIFVELRQLDGSSVDRNRRLFEVMTAGLQQEVEVKNDL